MLSDKRTPRLQTFALVLLSPPNPFRVKNCFILGSGRSGTSMVAGCLAKAGYYMGAELYAPNSGNPKGLFEDREINAINEALLRTVTPLRIPLLGRWLHPDRPGRWQRWLARVPEGLELSMTPRLERRIRRQVGHEPYCFKDPRFSYTLPAWQPNLRNEVYVCVFRHPASTIESIVKESRRAPHLVGLVLSRDHAADVWRSMYRRIIKMAEGDARFLFVHFNQVLEGSGLEAIRKHTGAQVDPAFPEPQLRRSAGTDEVTPDLVYLYQQLCGLSGFEKGSHGA